MRQPAEVHMGNVGSFSIDLSGMKVRKLMRHVELSCEIRPSSAIK